MFALLLAGIYSAYKHFSGLDPLKLDPQSIISNVLGVAAPYLKQPAKIIVQKDTLNSSKVEIKELDFRFLLLADSHSDNANLGKAISLAKGNYPDLAFVIGLGDYTQVGTPAELKDAKNALDSSGLRYFLIPGDHDLWDCRNRSQPETDCFSEVFGLTYQSFTFNNFQFLLLDNSDNYQGIGTKQQEWIANELTKAKNERVLGIFVFIHEPLYHPSSDHFMGRVEEKVKSQAKALIYQLKAADVESIFAGDVHYFSKYLEPETNLSMFTIGAVTIERNPQAPRFAVVSVFKDGNFEVEDIQIK